MNDNEGDDISLDKIVIALENIEAEDLQQNEDIQNWLKQITSPEFKLIDSFINLFLDSINDIGLATTIFKVLIKLNYYKKDIVLPQLQENPQLFKSVVEFLSKADKNNITCEPFLLVLDICQKNDYKNVKSIL